MGKKVSIQQPTLPEMTKTQKQFVLDDGKARLCQDVPKLVAPSQQLCYAHATCPKNPLPTFAIANHLWLFSLTQPLPFRPTFPLTIPFANLSKNHHQWLLGGLNRFLHLGNSSPKTFTIQFAWAFSKLSNSRNRFLCSLVKPSG